MKNLIGHICLIGLISLIGSTPIFAQESAPGKLLIKFKDQTSIRKDSEISVTIPFINQKVTLREEGVVLGGKKDASLEGASNLTPNISNNSPIVSVDVKDDSKVQETINKYKNDPRVEYAEPDYIATSTWIPNDPHFQNGDQGFQWNMEQIKVKQAWDITQGGSSQIKVAVIDSGINTSVPEFSGTNFSSPKSFKSIYFDSNNLCSAFGTTTQIVSNDATDDFGHGTHVAATIAQRTNNGSHAAGIAFNTTIIPIKVLYRCLNGANLSTVGLNSDIISGINHAVSSGAKIINMSLGGTGYSQAYKDAVTSATNLGVSIVVSTGNSATRTSSPPILYPAGFPETIAVGATRFDKIRSVYSQYTPVSIFTSSGFVSRGVDLVAPGGQVVDDGGSYLFDQNNDALPDGIIQQTIDPSNPTQPTTVIDLGAGPCADADGYFSQNNFYKCGLYQGTSMAAPHVTGVIALMLSVNPNLTPVQIKDILKNTAQKTVVPNYNSLEYGAGLLDAFAAISAVNTLNPTPTPTPTVTIAPTATIVPTATPTPVVFYSNLSAELLGWKATFRFIPEVSATSPFFIDLSTISNMSSDNYGNFAEGGNSPIISIDPTKWDKYSCGRTLYWRVRSQNNRLSPIQTAVVDCSVSAPTPTPTPTIAPTPMPTYISDTPVTRSVLVIKYNPIIPSKGNKKLLEYKTNWNNPDQINNQIVADFPIISHGYLSYRLQEVLEINGLPAKADGFTFTPDSYVNCIDASDSICHAPDLADYPKIFTDNNICAKNVDEVWLWGGPWFGFAEFNPVTYCGKTQFVMGLSYERNSDDALHIFGHRMEHVGEVRVGRQAWAQDETNEFNKFSLINGHCGNIHYPPGSTIGSTAEYIYNKTTPVSTDCDGYLNYPNGPFTNRQITCQEWSCTALGYFKWWLTHIPSKSGTSLHQGRDIYNNWWKYYANYDQTQNPVIDIIQTPTAAPTEDILFPINWSTDQIMFSAESLYIRKGTEKPIVYDMSTDMYTANISATTNPNEQNLTVEWGPNETRVKTVVNFAKNQTGWNTNYFSLTLPGITNPIVFRPTWNAPLGQQYVSSPTNSDTIVSDYGGEYVLKIKHIRINPFMAASRPPSVVTEANKNVLLLIDQSDYLALSNEINQFKTDVSSVLGITVEIKNTNNLKQKNPDEIRQVIKDACGPDSIQGCTNIEGAILIGDVPYPLYDQMYSNFSVSPFTYYYEDLDATFDKRNNGHYYRYADLGNHEGPEIYVAVIKPLQTPNTNTYLDQLKKYFQKHHAYLSGNERPAESALFASHCDIKNAGTFSSYVKSLYGDQNVKDVYPSDGCDNICPLKNSLFSELVKKPELSYLHSHGSPTSMWCMNSGDFLSLSSQPLVLFSWGCNNGNFHESESNSTALAFINGKSLGLSYVGKLDSDDINIASGFSVNTQVQFLDEWKKGTNVGKALLKNMNRYRYFVNDAIPGGFNNFVNFYRTSGPFQRIIIGSPFSWSNKANPILPIVGDLNSDKKVDMLDYNVFITKFGDVGGPADFDNNNKVDIFDYAIFVSNFGKNI